MLLDLCLALTTQLYDKWDDFNFSIVNFIPFSPAYGVYISQLNRFDIRSLFNSRQSTEKQVDVIWFSTEIGLKAGVTDRQGMLTSLGLLIPSLVYAEVCACPIL
jgi:hypothetical protein